MIPSPPFVAQFERLSAAPGKAVWDARFVTHTAVPPSPTEIAKLAKLETFGQWRLIDYIILREQSMCASSWFLFRADYAYDDQIRTLEQWYALWKQSGYK